MTGPGRTMWLHPWAARPTCMPCQASRCGILALRLDPPLLRTWKRRRRRCERETPGGRLWGPTVRYCSFPDSREPVSRLEDVDVTTSGLSRPPAPRPSCHFPPPQLLGRWGGGCWSWGTLQAAGLRSASIATRLGGRVSSFQLSRHCQFVSSI